MGRDERELEHGCVEGRSADELGELLIPWRDHSIDSLVAIQVRSRESRTRVRSWKLSGASGRQDDAFTERKEVLAPCEGCGTFVESGEARGPAHERDARGTDQRVGKYLRIGRGPRQRRELDLSLGPGRCQAQERRSAGKYREPLTHVKAPRCQCCSRQSRSPTPRIMAAGPKSREARRMMRLANHPAPGAARPRDSRTTSRGCPRSCE